MLFPTKVAYIFKRFLVECPSHPSLIVLGKASFFLSSMMEYKRTPQGWNKKKTTQRKQEKQKLTKRQFHGIKFPNVFQLPRDTQNTHTRHLGHGDPT